VKITKERAKSRGAERRINAMVFKESKLRKLRCFMGVAGRFFSKKRRAHSRIEWARHLKRVNQDYLPAFSKSYNAFTSASANALL
jgi:hypothetical protein